MTIRELILVGQTIRKFHRKIHFNKCEYEYFNMYSNEITQLFFLTNSHDYLWRQHNRSPSSGMARDVIYILRIYNYRDVIMSAMASQITRLTIVYSTVYSGADQREPQSPTSLAFVRAIHRSPVNSPHKWPVTRKMFPCDDVIMRPWYDGLYAASTA